MRSIQNKLGKAILSRDLDNQVNYFEFNILRNEDH